jgi:hypothetical protein
LLLLCLPSKGRGTRARKGFVPRPVPTKTDARMQNDDLLLFTALIAFPGVMR